ncbi:MAG: glycosyltransferase family 39 protein [Blastocatellia bacterium]|nr:glycosyltransferase family 39 protein [Blastocatellia bacterium]
MGSALDGLISLPAFAPRSPASRVARTIAFAFVFVVALGVRLLYAGPAASACYGVEQDRYRIAHFYHQASADLADGDDRVVFPSGLEAGDTLVVGYPPGYFVFLAAVYRVSGSSMEAALVAQCVIDALTCVVLVLLGEALFSLGVGTVAGLLMAVSPQFAALSVVLKPDTLTVLPVLLALLLVVVAARRDDLRLWICAGLSLGLACWFRQNALLLAPVIAAAGCLLASDGPRRAVRGAVALTVATFVCVLPLTVRNVALYGEAIPVTTGSGFALLSGLARDDIEGRYGLSRFAFNVSIEEAEARGLASNAYFDEYDRMQSTHRRPFEVKHTVLSIFAVDGIAPGSFASRACDIAHSVGPSLFRESRDCSCKTAPRILRTEPDRTGRSAARRSRIRVDGLYANHRRRLVDLAARIGQRRVDRTGPGTAGHAAARFQHDRPRSTRASRTCAAGSR